MKRIIVFLLTVMLSSYSHGKLNERKIDRLLHLLLKREEAGQSRFLERDHRGRLVILVDTKEADLTRKWLEEQGGSAGSYAGGILTARIPEERLTEFVNLPQVNRVSPSRKLRPLLDQSILAVSGDEAHSGTGLGREVLGNDVIVGIVDTGIDYKHSTFKNPDGSTRLLSLWDHKGIGSGPVEFNYGLECDIYALNSETCKEKDTDPDYSHGTHVAGIAAGSDSFYKGIAPGAMLVIVKTDYTEASVIDGVDYIFRMADKYAKPAVVNLSLGGQYGPHDGTGELVRALEALQGPGKIIVAAAGNSGNYRTHVGYKVLAEQWSIFDAEQNQTQVMIEAWYDTLDTLDFAIAALRPNNQLCDKTSFVPQGQSLQKALSCGSLDCGTVVIDTQETNYPGNGDRVVYFMITAPSQTKPLERCRWALGVKPGTGGANFDAWITTENAEFSTESGGVGGLNNVLPGDSIKTISVPADGKEIIAVGSFTTKDSWQAKDGQTWTCYCNDCSESCILNDISTFSSLGPTRDGKIKPKPDITAPGEWIASAKSSDVTEISQSLLLPRPGFFMLAGTSMASPHVAGAVALMLDWNPRLSPQEVKEHLCNNADTDAFTQSPEQTPNNVWGCGKLNIIKTLKNLPSVPIDSTPPLISNLNLDLSDHKVTATWESDELADSALRVTYDNGDELSATVMSFSTIHSLDINGLQSGTIFKIEVTSRDPRGNIVTVSDIRGVLPDRGCGCTGYSTGSGDNILLPVFLVFFSLIFRMAVYKTKNKRTGG